MEFHEVAALFPLLEGAEFEQLKTDIAENGLLEPIWLHDGKILDGRNRYRACVDLGIGPEYREWDGDDPESFVISMNLHRRHLDRKQRQMWSVKLRQRGYSYPRIGEVLGISDVQAMRDVKRATSTNVEVANTLPDTITGRDGKVRPAVMPREESDGEVTRIQVRDLEKSMAQLKQIEEQVRQANGMAVHYSSETPEWYTPQHIIDRVVQVLGEIDLDPCSDSKESPNVPAKHHLTKEDDGLAHPWYGCVYMNPPYGKEIAAWVEYLCEQWAKGNTPEAIALLPARTDTRWFRRLRGFPKCFLWGRLKFSDSQQAAPFPSMVVYLGPDVARFNKAFKDIGDTHVLLRPRDA